MWKYVSRRIRDTFERSVNHLDKRSSAGVVNSGNVTEDSIKQYAVPCRWFACPRKCWSSGAFKGDNDTNSKRWNFEQLNRTWIGAITWSSALVVGWYASQLIHLKLKYQNKEKKTWSTNNLMSSLHPYMSYVNKDHVYANSVSKIEKVIGTFTPTTVHLISNDHSGVNTEDSQSGSNDSSASHHSSEDELGDVLNSIENRLGLAAIENGQHNDGLNLLRSAAHRNHAPALYNLGRCYEIGLGVTTDEKAAMELYRSAAALEHAGALYNLGVYYGQGRGGLTRDTNMATRLLRLAAVQGQQEAIDALKVLDTPVKSALEDGAWEYSFTRYPHHDSLVPTPTTLFVENVNYLKSPKIEATVY